MIKINEQYQKFSEIIFLLKEYFHNMHCFSKIFKSWLNGTVSLKSFKDNL